MKYSETAADVGTAITQACVRFVTQVRAGLPVESLAVVLMVPDRHASRVVFSWPAPSQTKLPAADSRTAPLLLGSACLPSFQVSLRGRQSPIGAALFRLKTTGVYGPDQQRVLKRHASQLALSLEDIQVQDRSRRGEAEKLALELIAEIVASKAPTARIYRRFARQIKQLLEYRRLSIYLTDFGADLLTCVYQAGQGVAGSQTAKSHRLTRTWCGLAVSGGHSYVLEDRSLGDSNDWPELSTGTNLRSVLVAPIEYAGQVMGAVVLEDRHPGAYGPAAQQLLAKAASLLGPAFAKAPPVLGAKLVNPEAALELQASSRKDFPADLAHALRTPLAAIKGYSSALLQTDVIWPEELVKEFLETIDRETDRLSQVVGELVASADEAAGGD